MLGKCMCYTLFSCFPANATDFNSSKRVHGTHNFVFFLPCWFSLYKHRSRDTRYYYCCAETKMGEISLNVVRYMLKCGILYWDNLLLLPNARIKQKLQRAKK